MNRKYLIVLVLVLGAAGAYAYYRSNGAPAAETAGGPGGGGRPGGGPGGGGGAFARPPMTVELAATNRADVSEAITVVGNLIGEATVDVAPKISGRLEGVYVKLGDPVARGGRIAKVEDEELREQVKQMQASFEVAQATVRQREADLNFAQTALERSRNLFNRQLLPRQTLDDAEARYQAANAQVDLARAQHAQAQARLDELNINLANTLVTSPVNGYVGKRYVDPGAFVNQSNPVVSVVDISRVRLVANLVERDLRRVNVGDSAIAEVDAFPGEKFTGRVARVAPVLDPSTRTAEMEIELPNPGNRLRPGMYARVDLTVDQRARALVVPRNAVVDVEGRRGVFMAEGEAAKFVAVETGLQDATNVEITKGLSDGDRVITTGAAALRDGDRILLAGARRGPGGPGGGDRAGGPGARGEAGAANPDRGAGRPAAPAEDGGAPATGPDRGGGRRPQGGAPEGGRPRGPGGSPSASQ
jgi:RND family efflux transporter MFP subunit